MGHNGGWPLNMFLNAKGYPFFVAGYLPDRGAAGPAGLPPGADRYGRALPRQAGGSGAKRPDRLCSRWPICWTATCAAARIHPARHRRACASASAMTFSWAARSGTMKFPQAIFLEDSLARLSAHRHRSNISSSSPPPWTAAVLGGLYDHVGGGFFRYTKDERWLMPHFEKMLPDNALMVEFITGMWQFNRNALSRQRIDETVDWMLREMRMGGAFAAGLEPDTEGEEGKYYLWTEAEVDAALAGTFAPAFQAGLWRHARRHHGQEHPAPHRPCSAATESRRRSAAGQAARHCCWRRATSARVRRATTICWPIGTGWRSRRSPRPGPRSSAAMGEGGGGGVRRGGESSGRWRRLDHSIYKANAARKASPTIMP